MERYVRLAPLLVVAFLTACPSDVGPGGGAPQIVRFDATPTSISTPGQAVTLTWEVSGSVTGLEIDQGVGSVAGSSTIVYPNATTTYTLTASNSSGEDRESVTVGFGPGGELVEDGLPPTLTTFGVSLTQTDFQNDQGGDIEDATDPRIVRVQPGGTFYAVVSATDPGGIASVTPFLANSSPPGLRADLVLGQSVGGFTLTGEVGGCILDGTQTAVTCIYEIAVGNIPNIDALPDSGDEFAYVFRTRVTDNAGLVADTPPRGYVIVGESSGGGEPVDPGPVDPGPTTYDLEVEFEGNGDGTVNVPGFEACDDSCVRTVPEGTVLELRAVAVPGSAFISIDGDCEVRDNERCTLAMDAHKIVYATFNSNPTLDPGPPGSGSNRAEVERLLGTWAFTYADDLEGVSQAYTFDALVQSGAAPEKFLAAGPSDARAGYNFEGGTSTPGYFIYEPPNEGGISYTFYFEFTSDDSVSGYVVPRDEVVNEVVETIDFTGVRQ
jgi:hypothetical protein